MIKFDWLAGGVLLREASVVVVILLLPANDKQARAGGLHTVIS
jgi:hypothetical protein